MRRRYRPYGKYVGGAGSSVRCCGGYGLMGPQDRHRLGRAPQCRVDVARREQRASPQTERVSLHRGRVRELLGGRVELDERVGGGAAIYVHRGAIDVREARKVAVALRKRDVERGGEVDERGGEGAEGVVGEATVQTCVRGE